MMFLNPKLSRDDKLLYILQDIYEELVLLNERIDDLINMVEDD